MKKLLLTFLLVSLTLFSVACDDDDTRQIIEANPSFLRVVHASPDAPEVDVLINDEVTLMDVAYTQSSNYLEVSSGEFNIKVNAAGTDTSVIDVDVTLDEDSEYTVLAINFLNLIEPFLLLDDNSSPAVGNVKVRAIHGAPSAPAVDIYVTAVDTDISLVDPTLEDVEFGDVSNYLEVPEGDYRIRITLADTKTVAIDSGVTPLSLSSGQIRTVIAADAEGGGDPFSFIILEDLN